MSKGRFSQILFSILEISCPSWSEAAERPLAKIAATGEAAGGTKEVFYVLDGTPLINGRGDVAFRASIAPPDAGPAPALQRGIWKGSADAGLVEAIALEGEPAPGKNGADGGAYLNFSLPAVISTGDVLFLSSTNGDTLFDALFRATSHDDVDLLATATDLEVARMDGLCAGEGGDILVQTEKGLFRVSAGNAFEPTPGAIVGHTARDTGGAVFSILNLPSVDRTGGVAFHAFITGAGVSLGNDTGIWVESVDERKLLARESGAAPALSANGNQLFFGGLSTEPSLNGLGEAVFLAPLSGGSLETSGIFRGSSVATLSTVALRGPLVTSDAGDIISFTTLFSPVFGADGAVYFAGTVSIKVPDQRPSALKGVSSLWRVGGGGLHLVAGLAGAAPGTSDLFGGITSFAVNEHGRVAFSAQTYNLSLAQFTGYGLWAQDSSGAIVLQVRTGDTVPVTPQDVRTVSSGADAIQLLNPWRSITDSLRRGPMDGVPTSYGAGDRAVFRLKFNGGGVLGSYGFFGVSFNPAPPIVRQPVVNSLEDAPDLMPGDGICDTGADIGAEPECTLRAAIQETNASPDLNKITFKITSPGTPIIFVRSALPAVSEALIIDATTQAGGRVTVHGGSAGGGGLIGLKIEAEDCTVKGLTITGFSGHGLASMALGINLFSPDISANGGDGISAASGWVHVDGDLRLIGNAANGLTAMSDVFLADSNHEVSSNGHCGILADGKVETHGRILLTGNGTKRQAADCADERAGGISAHGDIVIRELEASSNCGSGVVTDGAITIDWARLIGNTRFGAVSFLKGISLGVGDHEVSGNKLDGLCCGLGTCEIQWDAAVFKNGGFGVFAKDIELTGATARFEENGKDGIKASGTIESTAILTASRNGKKRLSLECETAAVGGIVANGNIVLNEVVAADNCGSGIYCDHGTITTRSTTLTNNTQFGIWCPTAGVTLGDNANALHDISMNGKDGVFAITGPIRIVGKATLRGNGRLQPGECVSGKVGALMTQGDVEAADLDIEANCGSGVRCGNLKAGSVRSVDNTQFGILANETTGVVLSGGEHEIARNGLDGIYAPTATVRITGKAYVVGNNRSLTPHDCDQDPPSRGGICAGQMIVGDEVEARLNCGTGLIADKGIELQKLVSTQNTQHGVHSYDAGLLLLGTGHVLSKNGGDGVVTPSGRVDIYGTLEANSNGRNGITAADVRLVSGEICDNTQLGIDIFGPGGVLLGDVNVNCNNGLGPIRTKNGTIIAPRSPGLRVAEAPNPSPGDAPLGQDFPAGFYGVSAGNSGGEGGGAGPPLTVEIVLQLPAGLVVETYFNYGPTADRPTPHWYEFRFDGASGAELLPGQVVLHLVDGLRGDDDLAENGSIHSLGGPAVSMGGARSQLPGDCNLDGRFNITDPICILGFLFLGSPAQLPCGDGTVSHASNRALLDWQPDGRINLTDAVSALSYLFLGGPAHVLVRGPAGQSCVPISGCPANPACR